MTTLKDVLEIIYYIAFIVLTCLIVKYARKTYEFQSDKTFQLFCKVCILQETIGGFNFRYALEVYNYGNNIAKNIEVIVDDKKITTIDFIKANESSIYPLGDVWQMAGCNRIWPDAGGELKEGTYLAVQLVVAGNKLNYEINTDLLYSYRGVGNGGTLGDVSNNLEHMTDALNKATKKIDSDMNSISNSIKKLTH
jgi:hypothetical protein